MKTHTPPLSRSSWRTEVQLTPDVAVLFCRLALVVVVVVTDVWSDTGVVTISESDFHNMIRAKTIHGTDFIRLYDMIRYLYKYYI